MALKVIISGGGTGGHIYPGISLAYEIKGRDIKNDILFVGTERGLESKLIPLEGFKIEKIKARGIKRKICFENLTAIVIFLISLFQSYKIIKKYKPDIVIGTGGYVSGSVVLMASILGIPTFVHEQNVIPGITNKFLSRITRATFLSFNQSKEYFSSKAKLIFMGNPLRFKNIKQSTDREHKKFNLDSSKKTILVLGGSKGAASINRAVLGCIDLIREVIKNNWQVLLISGQDDYDNIIGMLGESHKIFSVEPYLHDIEKAYSLADLVICRAGATTLAEVSAYGLPAILIPYPYATHDHQVINAKIFEREGAAILIFERDLSDKKLARVLLDILKDKNQLEIMSKKSRGLGNENSAKKIADYIFDCIKKN
ncbi:MAG: undecaprenyldiphospho-muramoylpentapeptide beta-N-acetylglucosaminyltransferase [Candidatus Caldatribacteriota bacterium]|nr:undecaprenyldiphospho-muramoylpentapeptide beta-N-acetylglucosaminyltransferase [Candidatus Caldatribacteriota bacterium]